MLISKWISDNLNLTNITSFSPTPCLWLNWLKYIELSPCNEGPLGVAKFVRYIEVVFHRFYYFWGGEYRSFVITRTTLYRHLLHWCPTLYNISSFLPYHFLLIARLDTNYKMQLIRGSVGNKKTIWWLFERESDQRSAVCFTRLKLPSKTPVFFFQNQ